jgi:hypothetical protein
MNFLNFLFFIFYFCGSFLTSWIRIRIQPTKVSADLDPKTLLYIK